ncbi:RNA polymerase sigma factor [Brevibacillus sp. SYP-B805]|uniref:sigma-70 family RNA polymerase sigma factor n=1 Tax=Brevibacillus sp. SYP-B805 TaxID=1578199 RepID=UPI0013EBC5D9|nr:RNA polymerase sigma factor [Brevibacillus sp. SYP-B805]NGQ95335.1 RNA polymerase sigma factor [Brevibacillus sp. SYP-B805]
MGTSVNAGFDELYAMDEVEEILAKVKKKCEIKLKGKRFAGMEHEDVVQEVLFKTYKVLDKYDSSIAKINTFLNSVIDNMIKDCYKSTMSGKNLAVVNAIDIAGLIKAEVKEEGVCYHVGVEDRGFENCEVLMDIMENMGLNDRERQVFKLRSAGYEYQEIAKMVGVSKSRVQQIWKSIVVKYETL